PLNEAKILKVSFNTKGRGYSGVMKRHNFAGGPASHGSRFHRRHGSIGNREWPGRVQPGMKMAGHYGNTKVTVKNEVVSYDAENKILVVKGAVPGYNGAMGKIRIAK
ncbi:50S ribosomal protein L3, partial [Campylobacter coli]|nr:50S ribosomal protein L3 [Campylobacter coli]